MFKLMMNLAPVILKLLKAVEAIAAAENQHGLRIKSQNCTTLYDTAWTTGVDCTDSDNECDSASDKDMSVGDEAPEEGDSESKDEQTILVAILDKMLAFNKPLAVSLHPSLT